METENVLSYGKFKSAEELLAAYNALEREFTKRCQLIKELQTAKSEACAQEETIEGEKTLIGEETLKEPIVQTAQQQVDEAKPGDGQENKAEPQEEVVPAPTEEPSTMGEELSQSDVVGYVIANAEDCAELLSEIPQVMDACIAKYKQKLISMGAAVSAVRGAAVITPVRRPKTLIEAKMLADEMLR